MSTHNSYGGRKCIACFIYLMHTEVKHQSPVFGSRNPKIEFKKPTILKETTFIKRTKFMKFGCRKLYKSDI